MKCTILHDLPGRLRVHLCCGRMTLSQADVLEYYLRAQDGVQAVKVYDRTQDAVVLYEAERGNIIRALAQFSFAKAEAMELVPEHTSRALNREFEDKLAVAVMRRCISKLFLPAPITTALAVFRSVKYIREGLSALWHGKLSVAVLDAAAVSVSMLRGDFATAASVMFMLHLGEILEEWTHKKSVADLASAMSLRVDSVWQQVNGTEVLTKITDVKPGDRIVIRTGGMIPLDGRVVEGEAMVNQSSLTGESMPVAKHPGSPVYAGTVAEEGECVISVEKSSGSGRYDRVVRMIEESEKLKSIAEDKASRMADRLVPYTLGGTALTYLLTRNVTKMLSVLMVDFSCALKLAIPIAVLSAMRESSGYHISVKGGRFLEAVAKADTIVFDKTGTLTQNKMTVVEHTGPLPLLAAAMTLSLAACGDKPSATVDAEGLGKALAERVQFDSTMSAIDAGDYLELPEGSSAAAYMSDGSTMEEIFVVSCKDKTDASAVKIAMQELLDSQTQEAGRYQPEEAERLNNAVFATYGTCVVLCVTSDTDTANAVIKEYVG